jgi:dipeptidyl aminopeptidase/acylaminoacyl peptidase
MASAKTLKPFGLWPSPVSPAVLAEALALPEAEWSPDGRWLVWLEEHSGKGILFASTLDGQDARRITSDESVRATVGYGGGNFAVGPDRVFFVERSGRLYAQSLEGGLAQPITPEGVRFASPRLSPDGNWIVSVYEQGQESGLAIVDAEGRRWPRKLAGGSDFVMQPGWSPDGQSLAWVAWDHPRMPWDGSEVLLARLTAGPDGPRLTEAPRVLAGGESEAVLQPEFSPDGMRLAYISDRGGWFQLYCRDLQDGAAPKCLTPEPAEFGGGAWQQGMRWFGWLPGGDRLVAARNREGAVGLVLVEATGGHVSPLAIAGYTTLTRPVVNPLDGRIAALGAGDRLPSRLVVWPAQLEPGSSVPAPQVVRRTVAEPFAAGDLSELRPVAWSGADGETVHGLFAAPASADYEDRGLPPLVVQIHGGPTSQAYRTWRPDVQFFTSRGFAFLDVNYRGSTGYGRAYRERLRGQWGVLDAEDAVAGLRFVAEQGWADGKRAAIRGSSAGGYTVLRVLTLYPDLFRAGVCLYGISELFALARETHKFEAFYLDSLIGELPARAERYRERSPIHFADRLRAPLIVFQGADDKVVPPSQSERIVAALKAHGVPHEYHLYSGEGHGFRMRETVLAVLQATERFLQAHVVFA